MRLALPMICVIGLVGLASSLADARRWWLRALAIGSGVLAAVALIARATHFQLSPLDAPLALAFMPGLAASAWLYMVERRPAWVAAALGPFLFITVTVPAMTLTPGGQFLETATQTGLAGLAGLILLVAAVAVAAWRWGGAEATGLLAMVASVLLSMLLQSPLANPISAATTWVVVGVCLGCWMGGAKRTRSE
jgi:hypothetical protein